MDICEMKMKVLILALLCSLAPLALAVGDRGTLVHEAQLHISPDESSAKLGEAGRGHELIILETSRDWVHVEAFLSNPRAEGDDEEHQGRTISGWVLARGLVTASTPDGDKIVFGEAADSEDEASRRRGRRDAAQDAMRLYYRVYDLFPTSPLAGQALYRAADIRWQLDRADVATRPSAREKESFLRQSIDDQWMKLVIKKFSGSKWADLAAFRMIDNKLCGDWQGASKCPDKEAELYDKYATEHPQSPSAPEALYDAAWRRAALVQIYVSEEQQKKSEESKSRALALAQRLIGQYPQSDWALRGRRLLFYLEHDIPAYGNVTE
jgi:hypothetical protein